MAELTNQQVRSYEQDGFLAVEGVLDAALIADLRVATDDMVAKSHGVPASNDMFNFAPAGQAGPRLRRINDPECHAKAYADALRADAILDRVEQLIGHDIRLWGGKLNMKSSQGGQAIEWHQDWAFNPCTNDDMLTVGIALDDSTVENGCLLVVPGSHKGPILDHWGDDGRFAGAVTDPSFKAHPVVPIELRAGGISVHHIRALHASAPNRSTRERRLLLYTYSAADSWPLSGVRDRSAYDDKMLRGHAVDAPRLEKVPVRAWPLWEEEQRFGPTSIYDLQAHSAHSAFEQ